MMNFRKPINRSVRGIIALAIFTSVHADSYTASYERPDFDRWMYPYNATPGSRSVGPTFAAFDYDIFDNRDGQILFSFITNDNIPSDMGGNSYSIISVTLQVTTSNSGIQYDPTQDAWETYDLTTGVVDEDLGRPMELFGAGFRGGYDGLTFGEDGSYGPFSKGTRNAYALSYNQAGEAIDTSNSVEEEFNPLCFAVGENSTLEPGQFMDSETILNFDIDIANENIQTYLQDSLNAGILSFTLTSFHGAEQPALRGEAQYPNFHLKESPAVDFGFADAAQLYIEVEINENTVPEDIDGDGTVGVADLLLLIAAWGPCSGCGEDITNDGVVNVQDVLQMIGAWSS